MTTKSPRRYVRPGMKKFLTCGTEPVPRLPAGPKISLPPLPGSPIARARLAPKTNAKLRKRTANYNSSDSIDGSC